MIEDFFKTILTAFLDDIKTKDGSLVKKGEAKNLTEEDEIGIRLAKNCSLK